MRVFSTVFASVRYQVDASRHEERPRSECDCVPHFSPQNATASLVSGFGKDEAGAGGVADELAGGVGEVGFGVAEAAAGLQYAAFGAHRAGLDGEGTKVVDADVDGGEGLVRVQRREQRQGEGG